MMMPDKVGGSTELPNDIAPTLRLNADGHSVNTHGKVCAGWLMAKMDLAGALDAEHVAQGEVTTVAVNAFQFAAPIQVGDVLSLYVRRLRTGEKSITSKVSVFAERQTGECVEITEAVMTFVAIDGLGRSRNIHAAH